MFMTNIYQMYQCTILSLLQFYNETPMTIVIEGMLFIWSSTIFYCIWSIVHWCDRQTLINDRTIQYLRCNYRILSTKIVSLARRLRSEVMLQARGFCPNKRLCLCTAHVSTNRSRSLPTFLNHLHTHGCVVYRKKEGRKRQKESWSRRIRDGSKETVFQPFFSRLSFLFTPRVVTKGK